MKRRDFLMALTIQALPERFGDGGAAAVVDVASGVVVARAGQAAALPGSTAKPFVAMAVAQPGRVTCHGVLEVGGRRLNCSHPLLHQVTLEDALCYSCNTWFVEMAMRMQPGELQAAFLRYRLPAERPRNEVEHKLLALGLSCLRVSPSDLALAYGRLAANARPGVRAGLERCAKEGTAKEASPSGLTVAGKTGTSTPGGSMLQAWFAGWAPAAGPRVAIAVFRGMGRGMTDAAPVAREVFEWWQLSRAR
jgi:cell division protein FtsI/penicillin-binding protein 2